MVYWQKLNTLNMSRHIRLNIVHLLTFQCYLEELVMKYHWWKGMLDSEALESFPVTWKNERPQCEKPGEKEYTENNFIQFHSNALNTYKNIFYFDFKGQHWTSFLQLAWEVDSNQIPMLLCFYWDCWATVHYTWAINSFCPYYFLKWQRQLA